jgi:nicotinate phosphoribosyltransferase
LGTDKFLKDFTYLDALTFRGLRHDSGDPQKWADKMLNMYRDYGINPELRTLIFSDSVNAETANSFSKLKESVNVVAGIGSYLTNPISPTHCVIKMETANGGKPVAKLSDEPSKAQCTDKNYLEYLKRICDGGY